MTKRLSETSGTVAFRETAEEFCQLIERFRDRDKPTLIKELEYLLPLLIVRAQRLPEIKIGGPKPESKPLNIYWEKLYKPLQDFLGKHATYSHVYDPVEPEKGDPLVSSLADDLADIYQDLKKGLEAWERASVATRREIVWDWRFGYKGHWGRHAIDALNVVHSLVYWHYIDDPDLSDA